MCYPPKSDFAPTGNVIHWGGEENIRSLIKSLKS